MIELFWICVIVFCAVCGIAVIALSIYAEYRSGGTELFFFFFAACIIVPFAYIGYLYGGGDAARVAGVIGFVVSYIAFCAIIKMYWFILRPYPVRKQCKLRSWCNPHYYNWIPIQEDVWYRKCYVCHQEYVLFCFKYETTVNTDGTLKPYLKRTKWGWQKDNEPDSEIMDSVTPEVIEQVREKWKKLREELSK